MALAAALGAAALVAPFPALAAPAAATSAVEVFRFELTLGPEGGHRSFSFLVTLPQSYREVTQTGECGGLNGGGGLYKSPGSPVWPPTPPWAVRACGGPQPVAATSSLLPAGTYEARFALAGSGTYRVVVHGIPS